MLTFQCCNAGVCCRFQALIVKYSLCEHTEQSNFNCRNFNLPSLSKLEVIIGFIVDSSVLQIIMYTVCKLLYAIYSRSRKGALEIGSSVSGNLTCWITLCFWLVLLCHPLGLTSDLVGVVSCRRIIIGNLDEVRASVWIESPRNPHKMISGMWVSCITSLIRIWTFNFFCQSDKLRLELEFRAVKSALAFDVVTS